MEAFPNLHPIAVHFPIALWLAAVLVDTLRMLRPRDPRGLLTAQVLYVLALVGLLAAYFSGQEAASLVEAAHPARAVLERHEQLALWSLWGGVGVVFLRLAFREGLRHRRFAGLLVLLGWGVAVLIGLTARQGGLLVYRYGVGVQTPPPLELLEQLPEAPDCEKPAETPPDTSLSCG